MSHSNKEIIELLKNPVNFEIALDIKAYVEEIDLDIKNNFISNVVKLLNDRLVSENISREWVATGFDGWSVGNSISLETSLSKYCVVYGNLFHYLPKERQLGWHRKDKKIDTSDESVKKLIGKMYNDYLSRSSNEWLCCITGVNQKIKIHDMDMSWDEPETKLAIMKDNLKDHSQGDTTIAKSLADAMWDIFSKYRTDVENLASFKS